MNPIHLGLLTKKIIHNKDKKQLNYKNAYLKLYDIPILYFKIFHPDPTVKRQSDLLNCSK